MPACHLKIYRGPDEAVAPKFGQDDAGHACVTAPLSEVLPLLADAYHAQRTWLGDFSGDEITISADLYEVLLAYQFYRRPSA